MSEVVKKAQAAKKAAAKLAVLNAQAKNEALLAIAHVLEDNMDKILEANALDMKNGQENGMAQSLLDRLALNEQRIKDMALGLRQIVALPDPVGEVLSSITRPNGLIIEKIRVPLGLIGMIYEARPNVTVDSTALALKTGNGILLRGSSTALNSNLCLVDLIHQALAGTQVPADVVQLIADSSREGVNEMLKLNQYLDILIPRGGGSLIRNVLENASVPVLQTGVGNCHIYVDSSAKYPMVKDIVINAKTQRPAVCNAAETLLVAEDWAKQHLEKLCGALLDANVQLKGCSKAKAFCPAMLDAQEEDWQNEFLDLVMAVRVVTGLDEALEHIDKYGTKHTEAIISEDPENTRLFLQMVDAAAVNHNASTRFTDGFEFGFGAEIGISTQKLHARGPVGLPELTSYKYLVHGQGQIRK